MAASSRAPAIAWSQNGEMPSTYERRVDGVEQQRAEGGAPTALPLPPKIATPPTTTAATTISS